MEFLADRLPKEHVANKYPEVAACLGKRWSVMMENSQETVAWVGIAQVAGAEAVFFLPHGAPADVVDRERFAKSLMRAVVRFARENARRGEDQDTQSATQAALLAELALDYRDNGLYSVREKIRSRGDGKPNWALTVKSQVAFPSATRSPIYCDIASTRFSSQATNIIALIQEQIIGEIGRAHLWWLEPYFGDREIPRPKPIDWPREIWPKLLRVAQRDLFQARAIRLSNMLLAYLENERQTGVGNIICGLSDFSTLWEVMLRETLDDVGAQWNSWLPKPSYCRPDGLSEQGGQMLLDIVLERGNCIIILDAKYYRATSKGFVPGVADVSKQVIYQRAVESTGRVVGRDIANAFVFPSTTTARQPYDKVRFTLPSGQRAPGFPPIGCQYVSVSDVVTAYVARRKLDDQSWLDRLAQPAAPEDVPSADSGQLIIASQ